MHAGIRVVGQLDRSLTVAAAVTKVKLVWKTWTDRQTEVNGNEHRQMGALHTQCSSTVQASSIPPAIEPPFLFKMAPELTWHRN
jgi:hypothetical protein